MNTIEFPNKRATKSRYLLYNKVKEELSDEIRKKLLHFFMDKSIQEYVKNQLMSVVFQIHNNVSIRGVNNDDLLDELFEIIDHSGCALLMYESRAIVNFVILMHYYDLDEYRGKKLLAYLIGRKKINYLKDIPRDIISEIPNDLSIVKDDEFDDIHLSAYFKYFNDNIGAIDYSFWTFVTAEINFNYIYDYYMLRARLLNELKHSTIPTVVQRRLGVLKSFERLNDENKTIMFNRLKHNEVVNTDPRIVFETVCLIIEEGTELYEQQDIINFVPKTAHFI